LISADSPDETRVLADRVERSRYGHEPNAWSASQQLGRVLGAEVLGELRVDRE
jgi:hypothetical protein